MQRQRGHAARQYLSGVLSVVLVAGLVWGLPPRQALAATGDPEKSVPVSPLTSKPAAVQELPKHQPAKPSWPAAGAVEVELPSAGAASAKVGGLPIVVSAATADETSGRLAAAPSKVRVEVLDRAAAQRGGVPLALRVSRVDGVRGTGKMNFRVDYGAFREAFGGVYASRLELRLLPECGLSAVTDKQAAARGDCAGVALATDNDFTSGVVSADIDFGTVLRGLSQKRLSPRDAAMAGVDEVVAAAGTAVQETLVVALTSSGDARGVGTFNKTSLKEAHSWSAGGNSGNFTYSYPMAVPPVPGGLAPTVSLGYSSQAVDGQTAGENVQSGLVGEGWSLNGGGFIESTFRPCSQDQDHSPAWTTVTADPCWRHENYQLSWNGASGELVPTGTPNVWKVAGDVGSRVEYVTGMPGLYPHLEGDHGRRDPVGLRAPAAAGLDGGRA